MFVRNELGFGRLCVVDVALRAVKEVAKGVHHSLSWVGERLVAVRSGARTPNQLVAYDTGTWTRTVLAQGPVAGFEAALTEPEPVTWSGDDGTVLYGRFYRASRARSGGVDPRRAHRSVGRQIPPAYRGSRRARMVGLRARSPGQYRSRTRVPLKRSPADGESSMSATRSRECDHSARSTDVVAMGGSAGGFTALGLLAAHSDVVSAGVVVYPVTDPVALGGVTHRFERHYTQRLAAPSEVRPDLDTVRGPLLVLQGADDVVVPARHHACVRRTPVRTRRARRISRVRRRGSRLAPSGDRGR